MPTLGPNDPRGLRDSGKTWTDSFGEEHPIMLDANGNEVKVVRGSQQEVFSEGGIEKLDQQLRDAGGEGLIGPMMQQLEDEKKIRDAVDWDGFEQFREDRLKELHDEGKDIPMP
jgi:hypothetical protein